MANIAGISTWVAGMTPPESRLIGWTPKIPAGLPIAGSISSGEAGDVVFEYIRKLRDAKIDPRNVLPEIDRFHGPRVCEDTYQSPGVYCAATSYLLAYYTNGPLPEDQFGELGDFPNWPQTGDTFVQKVFGWAAKTAGWDGFVPHYELRKVMQVQKWNNAQSKWFVYNQWGHDLTYEFDPVNNTWSAGFDLGTWMNAHGAEIFAIYQAVYTAIAAMTGYGAVLGAIQGSMTALAKVAATGDWGQIIKAIGGVAGAMAQLPGVAEFGDQLLKAGGSAISDVFVGPVSQDVLKAVLSAADEAKEIGGGVEKIVNKTKELMQIAEKSVDVLKQAGLPYVSRTAGRIEDDIRAIRENLTPDHLKPWFDKAVAKGRAALASNMFNPGHPVPYYAKGTWDQGLALGTMVNVAKPVSVYAGTAWENIDLNKLTPEQKRALFFGGTAEQVCSGDPNCAEFIRQADLFWDEIKKMASRYSLYHEPIGILPQSMAVASLGRGFSRR